MTAINISSDIATSFTTVSDIFIDQYMPKANGEFVKVYLYLLRATGSGAGIATISEIADHFSNTEADIIRALNYWASEGILQLQTGADGQIIGVNLCSLSVSGMQAAQSNIQSTVADNAAQNNLQNGVVNNATQNNNNTQKKKSPVSIMKPGFLIFIYYHLFQFSQCFLNTADSLHNILIAGRITHTDTFRCTE